VRTAFLPGCAPTRCARARLAVIVAIAALAGPGAAAAHPRAPAVALDFRLQLSKDTQALRGVRAQVIDGDRALRLSVDPAVVLVVRGLLGEPCLRFSASGVSVNRDSPTAAADRLVDRQRGGPTWTRLTRGHTYTWHDHRLAPPASLSPGSLAPWSLPISLNGRPLALTGVFIRSERPQLWPWLAGVFAGLLGLAALVRRRPRSRCAAATALAGLAAGAALAANAAFATGDAITRTGAWADVGAAGVLALVAAAALRIRDWSVRGWVTTMVGAVAAALCLGSLGVFRHGVVISSLPPVLARRATAVAVVGGLAAAVLAVSAGEDDRRRPQRQSRAKVLAK
jgi:hypothetical protein